MMPENFLHEEILPGTVLHRILMAACQETREGDIGTIVLDTHCVRFRLVVDFQYSPKHLIILDMGREDI
jgi:hypothetical protein